MWSFNEGIDWKIVDYNFTPSTDFRGIQLINDSTAVAISSGFPARIVQLKSNGKKKELWHSNDSAWFIDGLIWTDKNTLLAPGDPINGVFKFLESKDRGNTWRIIDDSKCPKSEKDEAIFAASNSSLIKTEKGLLILASGGSKAGIYIGSIETGKWDFYLSPIVQGLPSAGIFGLNIYSKNQLLASGGNYTQPDSTFKTFSYFDLKKLKWLKVENVGGYRSAVSSINENIITTGSNGIDIWLSSHQKWKNVSSIGHNVIHPISNTNSWLLAGNKGQISIITLK